MATLSRTALSMSETITASMVGTMRRRAAAAVAAAGAPDPTIDAIRLCVSEALANAAMHAYPVRGGIVELVVEVEDDEFVVSVRDYGQGIGRRTHDRADEGGMGLEIIGRLTERHRITSDPASGTEICMVFRRPREESVAAQRARA